MHRRIAAAFPLRWRRHYLHMMALGRPGNFAQPRTFNEKINWRILNDRRPELVRTCDKLQMKQMARELVPDASQLRIPQTLWVGTDPDQIPEHLLSRPAILKPNDGSGQVVFLPASREQVRQQTATWLTGEQSERLGEWGYGQAERVMLLEELIPFDDDLPDYKFHVFDGKAQLLGIHTGRFGTHCCSWYDRQWQRLDLRTNHMPSAGEIPAPEQAELMFELAERLGQGWDFMRVDLYLSEGQVWFGEFSPYPNGGLTRFLPGSCDAALGEHWSLPSAEPHDTPRTDV
ncbi:ATP-grasp fold amidoligase family protein [Luteococcus sp. OSA5]|uniref:ATP-grasp fold amidoligase family protein n=1 Tax=Luteococcus sp. OSA5 TaxID=3401630 RepID=UPI003B43C433